MSTLRTTASALAVTAVLGGGSLLASAPTAQAEVPATYTSSSSAQTTTARTLASTPVVSASSSTKVLRYGDRGAAVTALQKALTEAGHEVPATGWFGPMTRAAVKAFQADNGIATTGVAASQTLAALNQDDSSSSTTSSSTVATSSTTTTASTSSTSASSSAAQAAVAFAYAQLGKPYVYGASGPSSYDCSGLTYAAYASAGVSIPRTSYAQWSGLQSVSTSNLQPGDLVIFYGGGHVGIYVGDGMVIHAPRPGKTVEKVAMSTMPVSGAVRPA